VIQALNISFPGRAVSPRRPLQSPHFSLSGFTPFSETQSLMRDYLRFLYIAQGSLSETHYFVHLAHRLKFLSDDVAEKLMTQTKSTSSCLYGLILAVEKDVEMEGDAR